MSVKSRTNKSMTFRKKSFGNVVKNYQKYRRTYDMKVYDTLFQLVGSQNDEIRILDIGCGSGKSTEPLFNYSDKYKLKIIGCDHDVKMLKEAKRNASIKKLQIQYVKGEAEKLPFDNGSFDVVMAGTAFHWFTNKKAIEEIKRALKSHGVFFVFWRNPIIIYDRKGNVVAKDIYKKFKCKSILGKWRNTDKVKEIFDKAYFKDFHVKKILTEQKDTIEEIIGGHKTNSKYAVLTASEKRSYIGQLTKAYTEALDDRPHFTSSRETIICWGFNDSTNK